MTAPVSTGIYGFVSQFGFGSSSTISVRLDFESEDLSLQESLYDFNGLRGTRAHDVSRVRDNTRLVTGSVTTQPTSLELSELLKWCFGGTPSGSGVVTYPLADTLINQYVSFDRGAAVSVYNGCYVDKCTFTSSQGAPLRVRLDILGQDETVNASGSFPVIALDTSTAPFLFFDLVLTIGGSQQYYCQDFELVVDNHLDRTRFFNSQTLPAIYATDRTVKLRTKLAYGAAYALYGTGTPSGLAATAVFTGPGTAVLSFTAGTLVFPRQPIPIPGRQEIMLPLECDCLKSSGNLELVTTLHT
jgi:hypothetical protein